MLFVFIRVFSALITSLAICSVVAWRVSVPKSEQLIGVQYASFADNFCMRFKRMNGLMREFITMLLYFFAGSVGFLFFLVIISKSFRMMNNQEIVLFGGLIAIAYYIVNRIMELIFKRKSRQEG